MSERRVDGDVVLRVPTAPGSTRVIRSVARSVAAAVDLPIEDIDDLCLAIEEAVSVLAPAAEHVAVRLELLDEGVGVSVTSVGGDGVWELAKVRQSLANEVLGALVADVSFASGAEGPRVGFTKRPAGRRDAETG